MKKKIFTLFVLVSLLAFSHPGRTDGSGGHRDRKNGGYHYHHGYPAHDHPPYESPNATSNKAMSNAEIKKNLETLGYYGDNAIAEFQKDNGLTPDGVAGKKTIKKIRERLDG